MKFANETDINSVFGINQNNDWTAKHTSYKVTLDGDVDYSGAELLVTEVPAPDFSNISSLEDLDFDNLINYMTPIINNISASYYITGNGAYIQYNENNSTWYILPYADVELVVLYMGSPIK